MTPTSTAPGQQNGPRGQGGRGEPIPLTHHSPGGGCGCKLPQQLLDEVLASLRPTTALRAGDGTPGAVEIDPAFDLPGLTGRSSVVTCDFLTPVVDHPYEWERIAATDALSDVHAMAELDHRLLAEVR